MEGRQRLSQGDRLPYSRAAQWLEFRMNWNAFEAIATAVAGVFAFMAWRTSQETLRLTYRPVVRPVPTTTGDRMKMKNIGNGPALAVMLVDAAEPETIIGEVQNV